MASDNYKPGLKRDVDKKLVSELGDLDKIRFTTDGYDKIADGWDKTRQNLWPELEEEIIKYIRPDTKILDLGCGNGRLLPLVQKLNSEEYNIKYLGLDPSQELIKIAKNRYENSNYHNVEFDTCNGLDLKDHKDGSFDQIISIAVLHHIPPALIHNWLIEAYRVTKSGSVSIYSTWNLGESRYDLNENGDAVIGFVHTPNTRYVHYYNYDELRAAFTAAGYEVIEIKDIKRESGMSNTIIIVKK